MILSWENKRISLSLKDLINKSYIALDVSVNWSLIIFLTFTGILEITVIYFRMIQ